MGSKARRERRRRISCTEQIDVCEETFFFGVVPTTDENCVPDGVDFASAGVKEIGEESVDIGRREGGVGVGQGESSFLSST